MTVGQPSSLGRLNIYVLSHNDRNIVECDVKQPKTKPSMLIILSRFCNRCVASLFNSMHFYVAGWLNFVDLKVGASWCLYPGDGVISDDCILYPTRWELNKVVPRIGGSRGRDAGMTPRLWSENFTKKVIFAIFIPTAPPLIQTEMRTKVVTRGCNPPPFRKFTDLPMQSRVFPTCIYCLPVPLAPISLAFKLRCCCSKLNNGKETQTLLNCIQFLLPMYTTVNHHTITTVQISAFHVRIHVHVRWLPSCLSSEFV